MKFVTQKLETIREEEVCKFTFVQPTIDTVVNESELILDNYVDIINGDYTI